MRKRISAEIVLFRKFNRYSQIITKPTRPPSYSVLSQCFSNDYDAIELINTFQEFDDGNNPEIMIDMLESYIKGVRLQSIYAEVGKLYNESKQEEAQDKLKIYAEWLSGFTLKSSAFIDVVKTFSQRFTQKSPKGYG